MFYKCIWFNEPQLKVAAPEELTKRHKYNQEYYGDIENMDITVGRLMDYQKQNNLIENTIVICTMLREGDWCLTGYDELIPKAESLDEGQLGKIKPWHFMPNHMEYLKTLTPKYFELYNLKEDREQDFDLSEKYPEIVYKMKNKMMELKEEMITEGGDWYNP